MMSDNPERWKDCESLYPPAEEIAEGLQDIGNTNAKGTQKHPNLEKIYRKIHQAIIDTYKKPDGLDKNIC